ncbi:CoA transferase [Phenylobacterium soli]|uniref:Carnitine dehydratase n=1 Tax=Phenylobacterium soli TaxID=2170551 RepID=A0A328AGK3_9CAUL|nr:CoA transferase [Phenylobacterium soli]RAK51968.1 carnitine dehydratase [Phenylobacterium soli]
MLQGVLVLDFTRDLGAFAGRMLAELGADVVKVEDRAAPAGGLKRQVWDLGKRSLAVDFADPAERTALIALAARADIAISGPEAPIADAELAAASDRLIRVAVTPHTAGGPYVDRPATDLTLLAASGLLNIGGDPDRAPLRLPGEQAYALAGIQGAIAALMALNARHLTGRGQKVEVSAFQSATLAGYRDPIVWEWTGRIGARTGNQLVRGSSAVKQVFACRDGFVTWGLVDNPGMLKGLTGAMRREGADQGMADVDWDNLLLAEAPQAQIEAWEKILQAWFLTHGADELMSLSAELGLGLSRIDTADDVLAADQHAARGLWREVEDGGYRLPGPLFRSSEAFDAPPARAPRLGEANADYGFAPLEAR